MRTLQNNFTTPEQSERLLKLGVPADSANCYYQNSLLTPRIIPSGRKYQEYINSITGANREIWYFKPCWSVCRLMEIMQICCDRVYVLQPHETDITQVVIEDICALIEVLDFSKLEDC